MNKSVDRSQDKVPNRNDARRPVKYFLPGQLLLHVEHPETINSEALLKATTDFFSKEKGGAEWQKRIKPLQPASIITFPRRTDREFAFSLIVAELTVDRKDDRELVQLSNQLNRQLRENPLNIQGDINLRVASPNWLAGGAPAQSGTGGPGGWPTEADPRLPEEWQFQFQDQKGALAPLSSAKAQGKGVHVAILDTAPTQHARDAAYEEWRWQHSLIESLLGPQSPLTVYPASAADLDQTHDYDLFGHRYLMRDHGLFIAGIIHTIAPRAMLHLYEVLNPYGVGSLETIARGLLRILQNPDMQGHPLIVNCSLMLGMPVKKGGGFDWEFDPAFPIDFRDPVLLDQMTISTREVFDLLAKRENTVVVAAAGNDAHYDKNNNLIRPDARYPAAFDTVFGVGALPKRSGLSTSQYLAASYSNLSDEPPKGSYITLGGEPGAGQGVLGVYIGEFPDYQEPPGCVGLLFPIAKKQQPGHIPADPASISLKRIRYKPNSTGWAWWAGTSFATPIISGILAANHSQPGLLATNLDMGSAEAVLGNLRQPNPTNESEKVILVRQG